MNAPRRALLGLLLLTTIGCSGLHSPSSQASSTSEVARTVADIEPTTTFMERLTVVATDGSSAPVVLEMAEPPGRIELPAGASVDILREKVSAGGTTETSESAKGATAVSGATDLTVEPAKAALPDGPAASGGTVRALIKAIQGSSLWILHAIGGLGILAGVLVTVFLKMPGRGVTISGGGIACAAVAVLFDRYPWVVLGLPIVAIGALIWLMLGLRKGQRVRQAFGAVTRGVQHADADGKVRDAIANLAGLEGSPDRRLVKDEVTGIRRAEGLV